MQIKMAGTNSESRVPMTLRDSFFNDDFFRHSWEDFDKLRSQMMAESQNFWKRAEQEMKMLDTSSASSSAMQQQQQQSSSSSSNAVRKESSSSSSGARDLMRSNSMLEPSIFPRRWMMPRMFGIDSGALDTTGAFGEDFFSDKLSKMNLFQDKGDEQIIRMKDDDAKFELSLDTHGFRPDEIKVNVSGGMLAVEAKHEEKGDNKFVLRQFSRKYTLPEGCEAARVNSNLSSDGVLVITAPKRQAVKAAAGVPTNTPIPVTHKN